MIVVACDWCDGRGYTVYSCCGDDITDNDIDLCPTCYEHCGDEREDCENCAGTGKIERPETPEEIEAEELRLKIMCDENRKRRLARRDRMSSV